MWRLVFVVVLWNTITSQPITDDTENTRQPRQLDFGECCPCPGSRSTQDSGYINSLGHVVRPLGTLGPVGRFGEDLGGRGSAVDDCPCRFRDADSDGSSSILVPRTMRPVRPDMRSDTSKGDPKPLLHPEVDLASSVLETLKEATDEGYQEALARDAARNAARVSELRDAEPEAAKNIIIVVNPNDDAMPEASNALETRCAHPLGKSRLGEVSKTIMSPKFKNNFRNIDMDSGASNVKENAVGINKGLEGLKLKTNPSILKLLTPQKPGQGNIQSLLKLRNKDMDLSKNNEDIWTSLHHSLKSKVPSLKLPSLADKKGLSDSLKPLGTNKLNIPKFRTLDTRKHKLDKSNDLDNNPSPSNVEEQLSEAPVTGSLPKPGFISLRDITKTPLNLKNLFKLKDVELIPPKTNKPKLILPDFKFLPPLRKNTPGTSFDKPRKLTGSKKDCGNKGKAIDAGAQVISYNQKVQTEILDVIPSQSQINPVTTNEHQIETTTSGLVPAPKDKHVETEILDALPSASEDNHIVAVKEDETQTTALDSSANIDEDFESQNTMDPEDVSKHSKEDFGNFNENEESDSGVDSIVNEDGNDEFEVVVVEEETDQPISEVEISDEDNKDIDLEIFDSPDFNPEEINFNTGEIVRIINEGETPELENSDENIEQVISTENEEDSTNFSFFRQNDNHEDALVEPSNQVISTEPKDNEKERRGDTSLESSFETNEPTKQKSLSSKPTNDILSSIKEKITLRFNTLKNPDSRILTISRFTKPDAMKSTDAETERSSLTSDEAVDVESLTEDAQKFPIEEKSAETGNNVNIPFKEVARETETVGCEENIENGQQVFDGNHFLSEVSAKSDMDSSATSNLNLMKKSEPDEEKEDISLNNQADGSHNLGKANTDNIEDETCPSNIENFRSSSDKDKANTASNTEQSSDMASGASESVFRTAPKAANGFSVPLFRQDIVQPSSLFDGSSLFSPIPSLDLSNLNTNLPTLEDISSGISSILGGGLGAEEGKAASSNEFGPVHDCSNTEPVMSSDASITRSKSALRPFENLNLDIFQVNPLGQSSPFAPKTPTLNLNSFKTKLSLPQNLGLKPLKLQSSLGGKNGGLFGATLTFGSDKIGSSRNAKPTNKLSSSRNRQGANILGNSLSNLPTLEEFHSTMRSNAQKIFNSPVVKQINEPIHDTLRASQTLGNTLKTHTENTMRNIQQSLASTLNEARIGDFNNVGSKYAKPQNVLEMVSSAHEDMNDKLHALHTDLKDRLSTIHDRIIEQTNLPTLQTPLLQNLGNFRDNPLRNLNLKSPLNKTPSLSQSSWQNLPKRMKIGSKSSSRTRKPITKTKVTITPPQTRLSKEQKNIKPFKMSKAASSLTPKTVEVPKLRTTSSKPPFSKPLERDESVQLKIARPSFVTQQGRNLNPNFRSQFTSKPQSNSRSAMRTEEPSRFRNTPLKPAKSFADSRGFASEPKAVQIPAPWIQDQTNLESDDNKAFGTRPLTLRPKSSLSSNPLSSSLQRVPSLSLPKTTESPLLAKVRDAIKIRLSTHPVDKHTHKLSGNHHDSDMARASTNNELVISAEPMKENVSYKCKMVCVRE